AETVRNFCKPEWIIRRFARRYGASDRQIEEITEAMLDKDRHSGAFWHVNGGEIHLERNGIEFLSDNLPTWDICVKSHHMTPELQELIKHADSDTLWTPLPPDEIEWREPGPGDRIKLLGTAGSVLVSKVMKDAHLSSRMKRLVKIAVRKSDGEIIAIPGLKRSRESLIDFNRDFMVWEYREKRNS
ncbi:MAG: hypothetical protein K2M87_05475, partial [Muribaculaceae bacterium]|nr:hypothetical protein [Muribaculaceae bacterium]